MIDSNPAVVLEGLSKIVPKGELSPQIRIQRSEGVNITELEKSTILRTRLRLEKCVTNPGGRLVTIDIFRDYVEVAAYQGWNIFLLPALQLLMEPVHPGQLVSEVIASYGIAIREIDVDDSQLSIMTSRKREWLSASSPRRAVVTVFMG
jgi:hypothetical protein